MKFLVLIAILSLFMLSLAGVYGGLWLFAKITYMLAHKNVKKVHKNVSKNVNVIFDIGDTNKMNLFEIKQAKANIEKSLKGAF